MDGQGNLDYHNYASVNVDANIEETAEILPLKFEIQVYPNPFTQHTVVSKKSVSSIQVYDLSGRLVETAKRNIIGGNLKPGIYFLKAKGIKPIKVIKLK